MADEDDKDDADRDEETVEDEDEDTEDAERRLAEAVDSEDDDSQDDEDEELGERGKRALDRMKSERKKLREELATARGKVKKFEDAQKSESQRLTDDATEHKTRADTAEMKLLRLEVAMEKGLTAKQAARLSGDTKEELEEDADELVALFKTEKKSPGRKPKEQLKGGGEPDDEPEETDPRKLAAKIDRNRF